MTTERRHFSRYGSLARATPLIRALLCPCDACREVVVTAALARAERTAENKLLNPPCPFCGFPMIWREIAFVCPYAETFPLHRQVRDVGIKNTVRRWIYAPFVGSGDARANGMFDPDA